MATAIRPLTTLQQGIESTKGTIVAATRKRPGDWNFIEEQDFYREDYPAGLRANVGGAGVITRKGAIVEGETNLTPEDFLWPMLCGVEGGVTPATTDDEELWEFEPDLDTGNETINSSTFEWQESDGSTAHYYGEAGYGMCESFEINWAFNQPAKIRERWFARARQSSTMTAALTPIPGRVPLIAPKLSIFLDSSWSGLGGTQLTAVNRSGSLKVNTGYAPNYTNDGRSDVDFVNHKTGLHTATLSLVLENNAAGAARFAEFRANSIVFVRLNFAGALIGAGNPRMVQIDGAYRFVGPTNRNNDGQQRLINVELESVYDPTGGKTIVYRARNELAALAA